MYNFIGILTKLCNKRIIKIKQYGKLYIFFAICCFGFAGCGNKEENVNEKDDSKNNVKITIESSSINQIESGVQMEQVISDMKEIYPFNANNMTITETEVIKRQTNLEKKKT